MSIKEVLIYDHIDDSTLFDVDMTSKPVKSTLVSELKKYCCNDDHSFTYHSNLKSVVMIDFMSEVRKVNLGDVHIISDMFQTVFDCAHKVCNANQLDFVYCNYVENSTKELERVRN